MYSVIIIGGGLAGLTSSIELARQGIDVLLIERKSYPHHKVCGEYISNEVRPYLESLGLNVDALQPSSLTTFQFTSPRGSLLSTPLDLGGFGVSRYTLDEALYQLALSLGVTFSLNTTVREVRWLDGTFELDTSEGTTHQAEIVIGAYGKRTRLDKQMNRAFMNGESPYVGVKYHIRTDFPKDVIALHNFKNGYCGLSAIEDDKYCLCYLTERSNIREAGNIPDMEKMYMHQNPHLRETFLNSDFLYDKPEVINEVSFAPKKNIENHILMAGDSAGLITPLCGNGMAMAIRAGHMVAREVGHYFKKHHSRQQLEAAYQSAWQQEFAIRLRVGRSVQQLFGREILSELALAFFRLSPPLLRQVIRRTHGKEMVV
jgi:menaquinone-9 beta-reductase